jgi:nucleoid DNA-binding protein
MPRELSRFGKLGIPIVCGHVGPPLVANPATGEAIKIRAKKVVKFRVAKAAKEAIIIEIEVRAKKAKA